jgi:hypothetical protein
MLRSAIADDDAVASENALIKTVGRQGGGICDV